MKNLPSIFLFFIASTTFTFHTNAQNSSVAIGDATPKANAVLYLKSPGGNQGLIIPIVSSTGSFGEAGMIVYNSTDSKVYYNDGSAWIALGGTAASGGTYSLSISGNTLSLDNTAGPSKTVSISSSAPSSANQFLMWDGSKWAATSFTQDISNANGAITVNGIKGKTLPTLPATTQALVYNGTAWVFQALAASTDSQDLTLTGTTLSLTNDATPVSLGALSILSSVSGGAAGTITDASIVDADISATAAIAGTKINPAFGAQNISTTGTATVSGGIAAGAASQFSINGTGNITKINNVATSFPAAQGAANTVLTNNGSGTLSWTAPSSSWSLTGNSGTNPATNFIGTTDAQPLRLSTGVGGVERMRIDATGNVGIGTAAPTRVLEINSNGASYGMSHVDGTIRTSTYNGTLGGGGVGGSIGTESNHPFYIYVANSGEKATFLPNGNVGINTNAPTEKLDVAGNVKISGALMPAGLPGATGQILTSNGSGTPPTWETNKVAFKVNLSGTQSLTSTDTKINFASKQFDIGNAFDLTNDEFVAPVNGVYSFSWKIYMSNTGTGNYTYITLRKNGSGVELEAYYNNTTIVFPRITATTLLNLVAGDKVSISVYNASGAFGTIEGPNYTSFCGELVFQN